MMSDTDHTGVYTDNQVQGEHNHVLKPCRHRRGVRLPPDDSLDSCFFLLCFEEAGFAFYLCVSHASRIPLCILVISSVCYSTRMSATVRYLHSLPKSKRALFNFSSEKKQHTYILYLILLCFLINIIFLNNRFKKFYGPKT